MMKLSFKHFHMKNEKDSFARRTQQFKHTAALWETPVQSYSALPSYNKCASQLRTGGGSLPVSLLVAVNFLKILDDIDSNLSILHLAEHSLSQYIIFWY